MMHAHQGRNRTVTWRSVVPPGSRTGLCKPASKPHAFFSVWDGGCRNLPTCSSYAGRQGDADAMGHPLKQPECQPECTRIPRVSVYRGAPAPLPPPHGLGTVSHGLGCFNALVLLEYERRHRTASIASSPGGQDHGQDRSQESMQGKYKGVRWMNNSATHVILHCTARRCDDAAPRPPSRHLNRSRPLQIWLCSDIPWFLRSLLGLSGSNSALVGKVRERHPASASRTKATPTNHALHRLYPDHRLRQLRRPQREHAPP